MFVTKNENGNSYVHEITGREFEVLTQVYAGALQRFADEKAKLN
jgi:hypothetical protein